LLVFVLVSGAVLQEKTTLRLRLVAAAGGVKQLRTLQRRLRLPLAAGGSEAATPIPV
jgi:hypothetical protein